MLDTTIKTYATRIVGSLALAGALALGLATAGRTLARTPVAVPEAAPVVGANPAKPIVSGQAHVFDGDTLDVGGTRIRLEGIDAPEAGQACLDRAGRSWPCGVKAGHVLARLIGGKAVDCQAMGLDKYGRTLGTCFAGGINLNAEMVRLGHAWAFVRYSKDYRALEADARRARIGIWDGEVQAPWDFRVARWTVAESQAPEGCAIKGNVNAKGRIYHTPWSPWYDKVRMDGGRGKRWFCSESEATAAGWRPAQSF